MRPWKWGLLIVACISAVVIVVPMAERFIERRMAVDALARYDVDAVLDRSPDAPLLVARAARLAEDYDRARSALDSATEPSQEIDFERALVAAQRGQPSFAERIIRTPWGREPDRLADASAAVAWGYVHDHRPQLALRALDKIPPDHPFGLCARGRASIALGNWDGALADFRAAVDLAPDFRTARFGLAECLEHAGQPLEAVTHLVRLPADDEVALVLAKCRIALAEPDAAMSLLNVILIRSLDHPDALLERGRLLFRKRDFASAERDLGRLTTVAPGRLDGWLVLRSCLREQGKDTLACDEAIRRVEADTLRVNRLLVRAGEPGADATLFREIGDGLRKVGREAEGLRWLRIAGDMP